MTSIANPLRLPGLARIAAGGCFIASGTTTLLQLDDLATRAERLFNGNAGTTDAPLRALLSLVLAGVLILTGMALIATSLRWLRRLPLSPDGPVAIVRDEVIATLVRREPPAYGDGPRVPHWPLRLGLADQLPDLTWWRREIMSRGTRAFVRSCGLAILLGVLYFTLPYVTPDDFLGPFPASFVLLLLFATATWMVLVLMLIPSDGPRIESFAFTPPPRPSSGGNAVRGPVIETQPAIMDRESYWLGVALGVCGVAVQCLILSSWKLSVIGFPLMATSIIRHAGSIAGGIVFFAIGERMQHSAAELLMSFRYESTLVHVDDEAMVGHGAAVRTESRGLDGQRQIVVAVTGVDVRESVERMMEQRRR